MFKQTQGDNKRYCESSSQLTKVPDTLDQEIWPEIEKALDNSETIKKNMLLKIQIEQLEQEFLIIFIKNMDMKNLMKIF